MLDEEAVATSMHTYAVNSVARLMKTFRCIPPLMNSTKSGGRGLRRLRHLVLGLVSTKYWQSPDVEVWVKNGTDSGTTNCFVFCDAIYLDPVAGVYNRRPPILIFLQCRQAIVELSTIISISVQCVDHKSKGPKYVQTDGSS